MLDLKLFCKLKTTDTVTLILKDLGGNQLEYYIVAQSLSYSVICSGSNAGTLSVPMMSFNIRIGTVIPLIEKNYKFDIRVVNSQLEFVTEEGDLIIKPLCVEYKDPIAEETIKKYIAFAEAQQNKDRDKNLLEGLREELKSLRDHYVGATIMHLSGGPSDDPFTPDVSQEKADSKFLEKQSELEQRISELENRKDTLVEYNLSDFIPVSLIASRMHELVHMCGDYAIVDMQQAYVVEKHSCPIQVFQGALLYQLMLDGNGRNFYEFDNDIVYLSANAKTIVFVQKYLPSISVDSSIITRGIVEEKYVLNIKKALAVASIVKSNFPTFKINLGEGSFELSNEQGELVQHKFEVGDAKTLQLNKLMRGEAVQGGVIMSTLTIPKKVQPLLTFFKENFTIYVKRKKIVLQSGTLYAVFGRQAE